MSNLIFILTAAWLSNAFGQTERIAEILSYSINDSEKRDLLSAPKIRKEIHYKIGSQQSKDWATPSLDRIEVANQIGAKISNFFPELFRLAKTSNKYQPYDINILSILSFSSPSEDIYQILEEEGTTNPRFNDKKRELLYNIGAVKPKDIEDIINDFKGASSSQLEKLISKYHGWGIPQIERFYANDFLSQAPPQKPTKTKSGNFVEEKFHGRIRVTLKYYNHLGYLPDDVRKRINELIKYDAEILGPNIPTSLQKTLMIADKELQRDYKLRKNGKGSLDLSTLSEEIVFPSEYIKESSHPQSKINDKRTEKSLPKDLEGESQTSFTLWIIGLVVMLAIVIFLLKGKSKR